MNPVAGSLAMSGGEAATGLRGFRLGPARAAGRHGAKMGEVVLALPKMAMVHRGEPTLFGALNKSCRMCSLFLFVSSYGEPHP